MRGRLRQRALRRAPKKQRPAPNREITNSVMGVRPLPATA
jgi:hypothetical protein